MRKRDCAFLTYLQTGYATATYRMTFKTSTQRILAYVHSSPMQMSEKISAVTGTKFTKFVAVVI